MPTTINLLSDGTPLDLRDRLVSVDVTALLSRVPRAHVTFADGAVAEAGFTGASLPALTPGRPLEIEIGESGGDIVTVFAGVVVGQRIEAGPRGGLLHIHARDRTICMTGTRRSRVHRDMTDTDMLRSLLNEYGLNPGEIAETETIHPELVQYEATDWDFMLLRAEANGLSVAISDEGLSIVDLTAQLDAGTKHSFTYGLDPILDFEFLADAAHQATSIESAAWDIGAQTLSRTAFANPPDLPHGDLNGSEMAEQLGYPPLQLIHSVPLSPAEADAWVRAAAVRRRFALQRGQLTVQGYATVQLLDGLELINFGDHFDGLTLITGIRHRCDPVQGWRTNLQFGLPPEEFATRPDISPAAAGGLVSPARGLQIGTVAAFEEDPEGQLRVKVQLGGLDTETGALWARLARPDAGAARGFAFTPEPNDEVVVGFLNNDPRYPVVLGSLHSPANEAPPEIAPPSEANTEKGIVSRSGVVIKFVDDDPPSIAIETPAGNRLHLSDTDEQIVLADQHNNRIVMSADGIVIESAGDLTLSANGNIQIDGAAVDVK